VLTLLALAQFMLVLDVTVVNVALPTIRTELGLERETLTWVVAAYSLTFGGFMLLGGRLADGFGPRRTLLVGLAVFTAASLAAGVAGGGPLLIAGRVAQGLGAALLSPAALAMLAATFQGEDRDRAFGVWAAIGGAGSAMGVLIGGLLTSGPGWRWVFFVNVPVGLLVLIVLPMLLPAVRGEAAHDRRLDVPGAIAVTAGTALLVIGLVRAGDAGWLSPWTLVPLGLAVLAYLVFAVVERRSSAPLIRPDLIARRPVVAGAFVMLVASSLMLAYFFLSSLYLQGILGFSALRTGLIFLPIAISVGIGAQLASRLVGHIGGKPIGLAGFALVAIGGGFLSGLTGRPSSYTTLLTGFMIAAFGIGPLFVTALRTTLANVPQAQAGLASGVVNTFHELGGAIGVAVLSTAAASSIAVNATSAKGFGNAFLAAAVTAAVCAVVAFGLLPPGRPAGNGHVGRHH
jgi:EmrB/QacA subfamily drug resistance transporter